MIRILLADDHPVILQGVRAVLARQDDLCVVGEAGNAEALIGQVETLRPDVVIMDLMMPGSSAIEVITRILRLHPPALIIILSMHDSLSYVWEALRHGARGYVLKCVGDEHIVRAVRAVHAGQQYLSPPLSAAGVNDHARRLQTDQGGLQGRLTSREIQILRLIAEGCTAPQIAAKLNISPRTVESHRSNLSRKLGVRNQAHLVRYAISRGLISGDTDEMPALVDPTRPVA